VNRSSAVVIAAALLLVGACSSESSSSAPQQSADTPSASPTEPASPSEEPEAATPEPEPTPEVITYADVVTGPLTTAEICNSYSELVDRYTSVVAKREKSLDGKADDSYKAAKFVRKNAWIYEDLSVGFTRDWEASATDALNTVSNGQAGTVESLDAYREASLEACGLGTNYSGLVSEISSIDRKQASVVTAAENKPWYPKGYTEALDGVAVKWVDGSDPCGRGPLCWYWHLSVTSESGCPRGLYVETNLLNSGGTVVSWTNASVPSLRPGQKAKLPLYTYDRSVDGIELAEISCR